MILKGNNCYYCENYVKHVSMLCGLKRKLLNVKYGGMHRKKLNFQGLQATAN